jgi:hypothetical protein
MSESLFLINPRRRRKRAMPAGLRRYWAARRAKKNPRKRRRRARMANPHRRRRSRALIVHRRRRRNPRRHRSHHRRRRNPIRFARRIRRRHRYRNPFSVGGLRSVITPAAYGAGGAIAMSIAYGYLSPKLPAMLTTGYAPILVKAAAAIGLGMLIGKFMSRQDGQYATIGGLTVVLVGAVTPLITSAAPTLPGLSGLQGYGDYIPFRRGGVGAYMKNPSLGRLGFYSPAAVMAPKPTGMGAYMQRPVPGMAGLSNVNDLTGSGWTGSPDGM